MYKVMIIDDEEIVRWGIRDLLDWEEEGFEVCEDGRDGRDGFAKVKAFRPDLVLVDIKMPGMTGLELIRAVREEGIFSHFVILTGYSDFEFAKTAIHLGVTEYLLKPIDEDELQQCVSKIRRKLEKEDGERRYHNENANRAKEELLRRIVTRMGSREELEIQMERHGLAEWKEILCIAVLTDKNFWERREDGIFRRQIKDFLQDTSLYTEQILMDNHVVLILQGMGWEEWADHLKKRNELLKKRQGNGLLIAVGHNVSQWYDLCYSYEFARFLMEQEFLFGQDDVLSIGVMQQQEEVEDPSTDQICMLIEVGDMDGLAECSEQFKHYCIKNFMKETDIRIGIFYRLMVIRDKIAKKYGVPADGNAELLEELNRGEKLDTLISLYTRILQDMCRQIGSSGSDTVIKRMYYYMEKNYRQDLKLEAFAKMFSYNSNYLGKMFRKEIGDSFNNILDSIRISNAKRLLTDTDLKVYQISEQVGYNNIDYFYMKFKKYVGISPREFQKECRKEKPDDI